MLTLALNVSCRGQDGSIVCKLDHYGRGTYNFLLKFNLADEGVNLAAISNFEAA